MKLKLALILTAVFLSFSCSQDTTTDSKQNIVNNRQTTGSSANDILSDNTFKSLVIELVYVEGFQPRQASIDNFVTFLTNHTYKPNGIDVQVRSIPSLGTETYSTEDIADIERENRTQYNTKDKLAIWAFFTDGKSDKDESNSVVLGTAYWNTSFVIFEETIQGLSNSPIEPSRSLLESTVINHELGHLLGLTNLGTDMQTDHEDTNHPKHCNDEDCLMYWEAESAAAISNLSNTSTPPPLDAQCLADLKANGGK
ncbi:membrane metalloprotease [Gaetbulibacter saemankumensis]|uniref:membrane metalloprotease n=1 Tax=Gaetbulibacter saemankumensis TaxID=311208 RepID=UPI000416AB8E|nr:membrane metalloprotease [Gaetbulibacter saemankumensis]